MKIRPPRQLFRYSSGQDNRCGAFQFSDSSRKSVRKSGISHLDEGSFPPSGIRSLKTEIRFHRTRRKTRSMEHPSRLIPEESMSGTGNGKRNSPGRGKPLFTKGTCRKTNETYFIRNHDRSPGSASPRNAARGNRQRKENQTHFCSKNRVRADDGSLRSTSPRLI